MLLQAIAPVTSIETSTPTESYLGLSSQTHPSPLGRIELAPSLARDRTSAEELLIERNGSWTRHFAYGRFA
jgi:hypothetical protein